MLIFRTICLELYRLRNSEVRQCVFTVSKQHFSLVKKEYVLFFGMQRGEFALLVGEWV